MRIPQLALNIENAPGRLIAPCKVLAEAGINVVTLSLADRSDYGVLRLIVREWHRAKEVLEAAGFGVTFSEVLAIEVRDEPGGLTDLLEIFDRAGINVEYMYAFSARLGESALMLFSFNNLDAAIFALAHAEINPVSPITLFEHLDEE